MLPWTFNSELLVDEILNVVQILMVVAAAAMALLVFVSLMLALETKDEAASRHGVTHPRRWQFVDGYLNRANQKSTEPTGL